MISWIVASHKPEILNRHLLPSLELRGMDELVVVEDAESITLAYAEGQKRATQPVKCYIHSDVQILDMHLLRRSLIQHSIQASLVGVIGSRTSVIPWWTSGDLLGSVVDGRLGILNYGPGGNCAVVDGLLLASRKQLNWDITWPGWHGYDADISAQLRAEGATIRCLANGHLMVAHNSDSAFSLDAVDGWAAASSRYLEKWVSV